MLSLEVGPIANTAVSLDQRFARAESWFRNIDLLANTVDGDIHNKVVEARNFIRNRSHLATPIVSPDGEQWGLSRHGVSETRSIGILAMFKSDALLHPRFKSQIDSITYFEQSQTIFMPPRRFSPMWRGILGFHEVSHAKNHFNEAYKGIDHGHWVEERDVFNDEFEILRQLYGPAYETAVNIVAEKYADDLKKGAFTAISDSKHLSDEVLEEIMGRPYSKMERGIRFGAFNIDAIYRAFDNLGRTDHAHVTEWIYSQQQSTLEKSYFKK